MGIDTESFFGLQFAGRLSQNIALFYLDSNVILLIGRVPLAIKR